MPLTRFNFGTYGFLLILICVASVPVPSRTAVPDSNRVSVVFTPPLRSISTAVLDIKLRPTFSSGAWLHSPTSIQIRLSGAGITCAVNSSVVFLLPFSGLTAVANINSNTPDFPILTISVTSGVLNSGYPIWMQISPVSTTTLAHSTINSIVSTVTDHNGNVASNASGTMSAIVGDLGSSQPAIVVSSSSMTVTFTPSTTLPPKSSLVITFSGATFSCDPLTPLVSTSTPGTASCSSSPLSSTVIAVLSSLIPAASSVTFSLSLLRGCELPSAILAAAVDPTGIVLAASVSGSISASGQPSSAYVQQFIRDATAGRIVLPSGTFSGKCNCNNIINETIPVRNMGSSVTLQGASSGSTIDCSGTGMRCLSVFGTSISISRMTFKGGSSPMFVSGSVFAAVRAVLDAVAEMPPQYTPWDAPARSFSEPSEPRARRFRSLQQQVLVENSPTFNHDLSKTHPSKASQRAQTQHQHKSVTAAIPRGDSIHDEESMIPAVKALLADDANALHFLRLFAHEQRGGSNSTDHVLAAISKTLHLMRGSRNQSSDPVPESVNFDSPGAFESLPHNFPPGKRVHNRKLLQLSTISAMFMADESSSGGCLLVIHAEGFTSLTDVNMISCSAVYGGGGFFNVSDFSCSGGSAQGNSARQGGGLFIAATKSSNLTSFSFLHNTVATPLISGFTSKDGGTFGVFSRLPDAAAAAGAGAWIQSLSTARNCTFTENLALAATTFARSPQIGDSTGGFDAVDNIGTLFGSHALGSGLFVLKMLSGSVVSEMNFSGCRSVCAGWCASAGTFFVGAMGGGSVITQLSFDSCESSALASADMSNACGKLGYACRILGPSVAMAAGVFIQDIPVSLPPSQISFVRVTSCVVQAVGRALGVCFMLQSMKNIDISSLFFENIRVLVSCHASEFEDTNRIAGLFASDIAQQVNIRNVMSVESTLFCDGCNKGWVRGGLLYIQGCSDTTISSVSIHNLIMACNGRGTYCNIYGGLLFIDNPSNNVFISNTSARHVSLDCKGPHCNSRGGSIYIRQALVGVPILSTSAYNVSVRCSSVDAFGEMQASPCLAGGGVIFFHEKTINILVNDTSAQFMSVTCKGQGCAAMAGVLYVGLGWSLKVDNMRVNDVSIQSEGPGSSSVGAILSILASKECIVRNICYGNGTVSSSGFRSAAFGGSVAIFAGSVTVDQSNFSSSFVTCIGDKCSSLGGFLAIISSIQLYSNQTEQPLIDDYKWGTNSVIVRNSVLQGGAVSCTGQGCFSSGGAMFAGVASRGIEGPITMNMAPCPKCLDPEMSNITIDQCHLLNNSVTSASLNATASGAAISLFPSAALISNTIMVGNMLNISAIGAFVGGAGVYAASPGTVVALSASQISNNDAGGSGSGGGIFVGPDAVFSCSDVMIEANSAGKGGGVHVDGAQVSLTNTSILNNKATTTGGGLFCVSKVQGELFNGALVLKGSSVIVLQRSTLLGNALLDTSETVGAAVYIYGAVRVDADSGSNVFMNGNYDTTVTEAVMSVSELSNIQLGTICRSGTVLNVAYTGVKNQRSQLFQPTELEMGISQCYPACLSTPQFTAYTAASGFLAACIPCPKLTYSLSNSSNNTDSISSFCAPCPFGAECRGGSKVVTRQGYWGWMISESQLALQFLNLPEGYGCEEDGCEGIDTCGHNHSGILCGSCNEGFSAAYFTTECVSNEECSETKLAVLVCASFCYSFLFSIFLRYEAEEPENSERGVDDELPDSEAAVHHVNSESKDGASDIEEVKELRENSFLVLMWYYQLTGLLLTMPNPMALFDSGAFFTSILGLVFGTVPVSQAIELPTLVFCTKASSEHIDVLIGNLLFYAMWAVIMIVLTFKRAWLPVFRVVHWFSEATAGFWDNYDAACEALEAWGSVGKVLAVVVALQWTLQMALAGISLATMAAAVRGMLSFSCSRVLSFIREMATWIVFIFTFGLCCRKNSDAQEGPKKLPVMPAEVRGKAWLDWGISAYSAILSLLVQCTTCVKVEGFQSDSASSDIRWFYDGRVVCFSDSGERPGLWQFWALGGVVFMILVPLVLALYMQSALKKADDDQNVFDKSALPYYAGQFVLGSKHWFATMFYQRIVMVFVIFYSISLNAPFIRGILAFLVCVIILVMDSKFQPYNNVDLQQLATVCSFLLVVMSAVMLRSQSLISSARQINFNPQQPDEAIGGGEASLPVDVLLSIGVIITCLTLPFAIMLKLHRQMYNLGIKAADMCYSRKVVPMPAQKPHGE